jgi:enediyne biosynthesis protein E4
MLSAAAALLLLAGALGGLVPAAAEWSIEDTPFLGLPSFVNVTAAAGLGGFHHAGWLGDGELLEGAPLWPEQAGPGACWLDADADGWLDLYLVNGLYLTAPGLNAERAPRSLLYRNQQDGTFADVTDVAGVGLARLGQGCAAADYDNDGFTDLYVTGWGGGVLFRNAGDGTFANVTSNAGVRDAQCGAQACWSTSASWLDYDRDGCLDLYVGHFIDWDPEDPPDHNFPVPPQKNRLFHNACDGTFTDATDAAGVTHVRSTWATVAADLDGDGWPDLYVSNDGNTNNLYRNQHDGTFVDAASTVTDNDARNSMGAAVADFDADGRLDIGTTNFVSQTNGIFRASGADYVDVGMDPPFDDALPMSGWALGWPDLDNDAWPDLMVMNSLPQAGGVEPRQPMLAYRNLGSGAFEQVAPLLGADFQGIVAARGAAWGDYDNDGDVDVLAAEGGDAGTHLYRAIRVGGNFLTLDLRGIAPGVTRDAIGARVTVAGAGLPSQLQEKVAGDGFLSTSDPRLHFGLGGAAAADVTVRWPDGSTATYASVRANTFTRLVQGEPQPQTLRALPLLALDVPALARYGDAWTLEAAAEVGAGAGLASLQWDFGDGASAQGSMVEHAFQDVGALVVRATATDTLGRAKTTAARVHTWDDLTQEVAMDAPTFLPHEPATGRVAVRFSDGRPVAGAVVHLHVTYASSSPELDALMTAMPVFVREAMGYVDHDLEGVTGADGVFAFTVPFSIPSPSDFAPLQANHPGAYTATATSAARGSVAPPAATAYEVGAPPAP